MTKFLSRFPRGVSFAVVVLVVTWVFFGPVAGFHHMIRCGLLCPIFLDAEVYQGGLPMLGGYEIRVFPARMAVSLVLWGLSLFLIFFLINKFLPAQRGAAPAPTIPLGQSSLRLRISVYSAFAVVTARFVTELLPLPFFYGSHPYASVLVGLIALVGGVFSLMAIFAERGFERNVAALCFVVLLEGLWRSVSSFI